MGNLTPIARGLLVINIAVFAIDQLINKGVLTMYGSLYYIESPAFRPWQLLTHMFLHADFMHLLGNMMGLFFFGPWLERSWGGRNFFIFYIACGFGGAALQMGGVSFNFQKEKQVLVVGQQELQQAQADLRKYAKKPTPESLEAYQKKYEIDTYKKNEKYFKQAKTVMQLANELETDTAKVSQYGDSLLLAVKARKAKILGDISNAFSQAKRNNAKRIEQLEDRINGGIGFAMLGASGAIFGILLAFALFFPNVEMMLLFFPVPIKAKYFVLFYMGFTIYAAAGGNVGMGNVAHLAHLGGAIVGFILARFWLWRFKY